jgi:TPP-dependent indolepyruvate ferredoxin oxidoreductase alpha subunit
VIRTIVLGSGVSVQGVVVAQKGDGRVVIRVGDRTFVGFPLPRRTA